MPISAAAYSAGTACSSCFTDCRKRRLARNHPVEQGGACCLSDVKDDLALVSHPPAAFATGAALRVPYMKENPVIHSKAMAEKAGGTTAADDVNEDEVAYLAKRHRVSPAIVREIIRRTGSSERAAIERDIAKGKARR